MSGAVVQALAMVLIPALAMFAASRVKLLATLGPVVICYVVGMVLGNVPGLGLDNDVSTKIAETAVPLALPLLLFSTDVLRWVRLARTTVISFVLACVAACASALAVGHYYASDTADSWQMAGMLVGVYTGGTANMSAIGQSIGAPKNTFILLNASDVVLGGLYFFFLMTVAQRLLRTFLPAFQSTGTVEEVDARPFEWRWKSAPSLAAAFGLALLCGALGLGLTQLAFGEIFVPVAMLAITTLGLAASFVPRVRRIRGSYELGEYVLLCFCVAVGSLANLHEMASGSAKVFLFVALVMVGSALLHFFLAALFRIDADTVLITSTATIFGPAFVGPVAQALRNREIVVSGLTSGLVGYAVGNYLGIGVAYLLKP